MTDMTHGLKRTGRGKAIVESEIATGVNHLAPSVDPPQAIRRIGVKNLDVAASFKAMRNAAAVLSVFHIFGKTSLLGCADNIRNGDGGGPSLIDRLNRH